MTAVRITAVTAGQLEVAEVVELYASAGWTAYTAHPDGLDAALAGSSTVVAPSHQRHGVGAALVRAVLAPYEHVRQKVLLTDDTSEQRAFYAALGWHELAAPGGPELRAFVQLR